LYVIEKVVVDPFPVCSVLKRAVVGVSSDELTCTPPIDRPSVSIELALRMLLPFISKSAFMALGVEPSNDRVLSNALRRAVKLLFRVVVELKPDERVVSVGFFAMVLIEP
jgi:hypothetical protein